MQIKFKRNSWHRKLQQYTLGLSPRSWADFQNLCPYFWITVFCMLIVPFVACWKVIRRSAQILAVGVEWTVETFLFGPFDKLCDSLAAASANQMSPEQVYQAYRDDSRAFKMWKAITGKGWRQLLNEYEVNYTTWSAEQRQQRELKRMARQAKRESRRQFALRAATVLQKTFPILAAAVLGLAGWVIFLLSRWAWKAAPWLVVLKVIVGVVLAVFVIALAIYAGKTLGEKLMDRIRSNNSVRREPEGPGIIRRFFGCIGDGICSVLEFFGQYLKASKENYCPAIEWED